MKIAQIGEPILKTTATPVDDSEFGSSVLKEFVGELTTCMKQAGGIGIAAPQVFDPRAIMIIASRPNARYPNAPDMAPLILLNPVIVEQSNTIVDDWEGCLSVPGIRGKVSRSNWVNIRYQDVNGKHHSKRFEGFVARIFLHEFDHLIGKTWLDHIDSTDDIMANTVWLEHFS